SPLHQPLLGATARVVTIAENFVEQVTDLASVVASVQTVGIEMVQHPLVRVRVHRLLTDETKYLFPQPLIPDHRHRLLEHSDEEVLPFRQQQVQDVDDM